ncbi:MAG: hypothetical protein ACI9NC_006327, partial [Verrucomicrobiales bacterium]
VGWFLSPQATRRVAASAVRKRGLIRLGMTTLQLSVKDDAR